MKLLLWINFSLFILHEMDAVRAREWKMMIVIRKLKDSTGDTLFISLHFFLFIIMFYFIEYHFDKFNLLFSIFLVLHQLLHFVFRNNPENRINNRFSQAVIFLMFLNSTAVILFYILKGCRVDIV